MRADEPRHCRARHGQRAGLQCQEMVTEATTHTCLHWAIDADGRTVRWDNLVATYAVPVGESGPELANPGRVQIVDCKATSPEANGASLQCDGRHNEEGHHGQDDPAGAGRINWTEGVAVYPFSEGPARDRQVGGEHYRKHVIQHWDIAVEYSLNYFEGAILKYLLRDKGNRLEDLKKARHTLDKLIEIEEAKER